MKTLGQSIKIPVMGHLVLGYPTLAESIRTAAQYVQAGVEILELQIPFSHPTADGPVITAACQEAVNRQRVGMADCLAAIRTIRDQHPHQEIMVMSYINRIFTYGLGNFGREMTALGIRHLIVPDLPVDSPLAAALTDFPGFKNLESLHPQLVPVLAANVSDARVEKLLALGFDFFYLMSDFKITGSTFSLHPRLKEIIATIKAPIPHSQFPITKRRVGIGFGISTPAQARLVATEADIAIIGSALIQAQLAGELEAYLASLQNALLGATVEA